MEQYRNPDIISQMISLARLQNKRNEPFSNDLSFIQIELRQRRKHFLGSYISLQSLVQTDFSIDENKISELSRYLAAKTVPYWKQKGPAAEAFSFRFYELATYAISSGEVGDESIDDIIQLAECLVRSRNVFIEVMKNLLPADMIGSLFELTDSCDSSYFTVAFQDAVLGAVSVFLGVLADPEPSCRSDQSEEVAN